MVGNAIREEGRNTHCPSRNTNRPECMILWILWLAIPVASNGLSVGPTTPHYVPVQKPMPWAEAREFCQNHYVDLAVPNTEEEYAAVLNATASDRVSFWLGLRRQSIFSSWRWVNGEELGYEHWYRRNVQGRCATLEAMLKKEGKLLARFCDEPHMVVCQGPVSPGSISVTSVGANHLSLSWNVSAFMQMTPHDYNVTVCTSECETLLYSQTNASALGEILISNLTSATKYFVSVAAFVVRLDHLTGREKILQNDPTTLEIRTVSTEQCKSLRLLLKVLKCMPVVPTLWFLCYLLTKDYSNLDDTSEMHQSEGTCVVLIP